MPTPVYLICSESGAVDEATKLTSFFNLLEKLKITRAQPVQGTIPVGSFSSFRMSAVWMRDDNDDDAPFEVQFVSIFPNGPNEIEMARVEFRFTDPFQRLNIVGVQLAHFFGPGVLRIEARIRRVGDQNWINRLVYPIILEEVQPAQAELPAQIPPAAAG